MTKKKNHPTTKPKLTKQERREKYTKLARQRRHAKFERAKNSRLTCFQCRQLGHVASHCPQNNTQNKERICFRCGSNDHSMHHCPDQITDGLPFATCYICKAQGHLASLCPQNAKGIYVHGGSCRICGSNMHRATQCPENKTSSRKSPKINGLDESIQVQDLLERGESTSSTTKPVKRKKRIVNF